MSTPHQGPGMWRQGDREGALDWLASLDTNQQRDLQRVMSAMGTARPMLDRMARVRDFSEEQYHRAGAFVSLQADRASDFTGRQVDRASEFGQQQWNRATEFGQQQRDRATEFGQRQWTRAGEGLTSLRNKANEMKDRVVSNVSRWWDKRRGASTTRSAMVHAAFSASRQDPDVLRTIQQTGTTSKELKQLNELMASAMYSPDAQTREQAFVQLEATWRQKNGITEQQSQAQQSQPVSLVKQPTGAAGDLQAAMAHAGTGVAPPRVNLTKEAGNQPQQENPQGEAKQTGTQTQPRAGKPPEKGL